MNKNNMGTIDFNSRLLTEITDCISCGIILVNQNEFKYLNSGNKTIEICNKCYERIIPNCPKYISEFDYLCGVCIEKPSESPPIRLEDGSE